MRTKQPFATSAQLSALATRYPTPFFLYDEAGIRATAKALLAAFAWNPGFKEYFAVKANPNPALIAILREYGCGLDCASATELALAEAMGITGADVMLSSNETPDATYARAHRMGAIVNLDDATQLAHYTRATGGVGATMCVRYNPGGSFAVAGNVQGEPAASKFGMTCAQLAATLAALADAGATTLGIHAFLASNTLGETYYPALARTLFGLARDLAAETGVRVAFVNLSGGVGIPYAPGERACDIAAIGEGVRRAFNEVLVPAGMGDVAIFTELGRYMLGPHGALVTRVIGEKHTYRDYLGVDASSADLVRPMLYGAYHHISVVGRGGGGGGEAGASGMAGTCKADASGVAGTCKADADGVAGTCKVRASNVVGTCEAGASNVVDTCETGASNVTDTCKVAANNTALRTYDVVGGLCEGGDRLATARRLPETHEGDLLFIHDAGAHAHAMGMNYNGHLRAAEVLLRADGTDRLIRRAETVADYFATLDVLGDEFGQFSRQG